MRAFYEEQPVDSLLYAIAMNNAEREIEKIPFARIRELCGVGPCVLIGRCGSEIFRGNRNAVSIFIHGDMEKRIQYVMETEACPGTVPERRSAGPMRPGHPFTDIIRTGNGESRRL